MCSLQAGGSSFAMNLEMNGVFGFGSNLLGWNSGPAEQMEPGMEMAMKRRATSPLVNGTVGESCEKRAKVDALKPPSTPGNVMQALDLVLRKAGDVQEELRMAKQDPSMGRRVFQCSACNTYYENWNLFLHMREVHKKHICLICLGLFGTAERLAKHLRGRHKMDDSHLDSKRELMTLNQNRSCYLMCVQCEHVFQEMVAGSEDDDNARTSSYQLLKNHRCESFMDQRRPEKVKKAVEEKREMVEVKKGEEEAVISDKPIGSFKNYNVSTTGGSNELKLSFRLTKSEGHQSFNGHKEDKIEHSSLEGDEKRVESEIAPVKEESVPQLVPKLKVKIPKIMPPPDSDEYGSEEEDEDYEGEGEEEEDEEEDESEVEVENNEAESQIKTEPELEEKKGVDDEQEPVKSEEICEESGAMEPMTPAQPPEESDGIPVADEDCQMFELTLDEPLDKISIKDLLKICLRSTITFCLYCYHARRIAVNGKSLALHMVASHRFSATVNSITAEELLPETIVQRFKSGLESVKDLFLNLESFDSETNAERGEEQEQREGVVKKHEKTFECFQCRFISGVHKELYLHNRKLHLKSVLLCLMCRSTFFNYSELLCHICPGQPSRVLNYDLQFRCCFCSLSSLPSAFRLMVHLRKHHATCEICLEECFDQFRLASHAWKHKLQHFCYRCGIAYRNKPDITKHLFWKHGTESVLCKKCLQKKWPHIFHFCTPPSSFTCEQCNLTFTRAVCLRVHKRLHSEELPHLCPEENCGEKFISKKLMQKHARVHSDAAEVENFYPYLLKSENEEIIETQPPQDEQDKDKEEAKLNPDQAEKTKQEMDESGVVEQKSATFPDQPSSLMAEIMNLPVPNLSESDSSDDDEDSGSVLVPKKEKEEPVLVENVLESDDMEETKECEEAIINIWENFKSYQATQAQQNPAQEEAAEEEEDLIAPAPPPILHVLQSDHDYGRMFKVLGEGKKEGDDEDIKEIKDISVMRNESRLAEKRIRALNGESSSSSESDSDSSCSCGSECSCSSSDGTSSCPTSSSDEEESNLEKSANRKKQRKPRKRKGNSSDNIDVVDTDNKTISSAFVMMRESDLETDESETDEEFYDQHPEKVARELLAERRRQEVGGEGSGSRASTPSLPPGEEKYLTKEKKAKKSKKKKSKKSKREKQNFVPPLKINIPPLPMIPKLKILSSTTIPVISTSHHHHLKTSESLASFAEQQQQLANSCDKSLKRSKRRRIPNRFYGYTSDDDSNSMPPATAAGLFRPTAPPQLTWKKEDLPSPAVSKSIAFNSSFSCNSNSNDFQLSSSSTNYSSSPLNTTTTSRRKQQQQHEWQAKEEEEEDGGLGRGAQLAPALQPAVRGDQQQQQAPPAWGGGGGAVIQAEQLYCFCRRAYDQASEMIACDGENCPIEWFHFECVNIIVAPQGLWFCPSCRPSASSN